MNEQGRRLAFTIGVGAFGEKPSNLLPPEFERGLLATIERMQEQAPVRPHDAIAPEARFELALIGFDRAALAVMVTGSRFQRNLQTIDRAAFGSILLLGAVVRIVAGENGEVDVPGNVSVRVVDEREKIAIVLLILGGDVQISEVQPTDGFAAEGDRCPRCYRGDGAASITIPSTRPYSAKAMRSTCSTSPVVFEALRIATVNATAVSRSFGPFGGFGPFG